MSGRCLLGIDYGRKRIGVAITSPLGVGMEALGHIARRSDRQAAAVVAAIVAERAVDALVIGLPVHANGDEGRNVKQMRRFCAELRDVVRVPIHEVDERHTSSEAELLLERLLGRRPTAGEIDARAAMIILRRYLAEAG